MAPPQLLELSRMCMFPRLDDLKKFSEQRSVLGVGHTMPVHVTCANGDMLLLPGKCCLYLLNDIAARR